MLAICGENGAGKSTLMKILSGVIPAGSFEGSIEFKGEPQSFARAGGRRRGDRPGAPGAARRRPSVDRGEHVREQPAGALRALRRADGGEMGERGARRVRPERRSASPQLVAHAFRATPDRAGGGASPLRTPPDPGRADRRPHGRRGRAHRAVAAHPGLGWASSISRIAWTSSTGSPTACWSYATARWWKATTPCLPEASWSGPCSGTRSSRYRRSPKRFVHTGEPVLQIEDFSVYADLAQRRPRASNVSLQVYPGEIVGLYGLVGAGRTELARALFGMWPGPVTGRCVIAGREGRPRAPRGRGAACRSWSRTASRRACCTGNPLRTT